MSDAPEGLRFECTECGHCCRVRGAYAHVYLNEDEIAAFARHFKLTKKQFRWRYTVQDELGWTELVFHEDRCIFLDNDSGRCGVYEVRPTQCRTFPFWRQFVRDGSWTDEVKAHCEGIGRGQPWPFEQVEDIMKKQDRADDE